MADRRQLIRMLVIWAARLVAAATFVIAAVPKADELALFAEDIRNYQAFPEWSLYALAATVPMIELVGAAALVSGRERWVRAGGVVLGVLTIAFIALIGTVIHRGIDLECGCFGKQAQADAVGWPTLLRDVALLVAIGIAMVPVTPTRAAAAAR